MLLVRISGSLALINAQGSGLGYIGGDVLFAVAQTHPEYDIACLVRNSDRGAQVASQYAKIRLVYGDLSDSQTLEEEAAKADVVVRE